MGTKKFRALPVRLVAQTGKEAIRNSSASPVRPSLRTHEVGEAIQKILIFPGLPPRTRCGACNPATSVGRKPRNEDLTEG
jgi:hypothetical protein